MLLVYHVFCVVYMHCAHCMLSACVLCICLCWSRCLFGERSYVDLTDRLPHLSELSAWIMQACSLSHRHGGSLQETALGSKGPGQLLDRNCPAGEPGASSPRLYSGPSTSVSSLSGEDGAPPQRGLGCPDGQLSILMCSYRVFYYF